MTLDSVWKVNIDRGLAAPVAAYAASFLDLDQSVGSDARIRYSKSRASSRMACSQLMMGSLEERVHGEALFLQNVAQTAQGIHLDLAHALTRDPQLLSHLLKG